MSPRPALSRTRLVGIAAAVLAIGLLGLVVGFFTGADPKATFVAAATPSASSSATGSAAPSGTPSPSATPTCGVWGCAQQQRFAAAAALLAKQPGYLGIVVRDRQTGAEWRSGVTTRLIWMGSTPKLAMATSLLERARAGQITLDDTARQQIAAMLAVSDDHAADALWDRYGGESMVPRFQQVYGMRSLTFVSGFKHRWGFLKCTPDDLANLMSYILDKLNPTDRAYLVGAMRSVGSIQQWGVWAGGPAMRPGVKDGWSIESDNGSKHWITDSVGFAGPDERYVVAVMYHLLPGSGTIYAGCHADSDLVATVFGARVPAKITVPDPSTGL